MCTLPCVCVRVSVYLPLLYLTLNLSPQAVRSMDDVVHDEHLHERGFLEWQDHPDETLDPKFRGKIAVHRSPLRFWGSELPALALQRKDIDADREEVERDWLSGDDDEPRETDQK
jgi:crotonobetainyl-CoA:carnitine CoA-transferase CaiB-like acyl-CoA transferase